MIVLPDPIAAIVKWCATIDPVVALVADRIGTRLPSRETWPAVRLDPSGGLPVLEYRLDQPRIQVHSFDPDDQTAMLVARTVRAALVAMAGYRDPGVIVVDDVQTTTPRLIDDPDRTPPIAHATFVAIVAIRPDP